MSWIEDAIDRLLIPSDGGLSSRLEMIKCDFKVDETEAICHCYCLKLDGQANPRTKDLAEYVADRIVDYAIPKAEIDEARSSPSTSKIIALKRKATQLFAPMSNTGEGGEMLLYILVQDILKLPQLISKMSLKTSGNLYYNGVDGIHVKYDEPTQSLVLYWGESKMYADINGGLKSCFESLKGFLLDAQSYNSTQERDLQLITANISNNVTDSKLEDLLVKYFDKDNDLSNNLKYKGVCFVGFDDKNYPTTPLSKTMDVLKAEIENQLADWVEKTKTQINGHAYLNKYEIHVFLIPFPSVEDFRKHFLEVINK